MCVSVSVVVCMYAPRGLVVPCASGPSFFGSYIFFEGQGEEEGEQQVLRRSGCIGCCFGIFGFEFRGVGF